MTTAAPTRPPARPASEYLRPGVGLLGAAVPGHRLAADADIGPEASFVHAAALALAEALERDPRCSSQASMKHSRCGRRSSAASGSGAAALAAFRPHDAPDAPRLLWRGDRGRPR